MPDYTWKVILVGNKKVGKTSITTRFVNNQFDEEYKSSQSVQFMRKDLTIDGTDKWTQLHIWDTLGQEKFKSLAPIFFRKSVGAFLVYDVTNAESFHALEGWNQQIKNDAESKIVVMLIANKVDLPDKVITSEMGAEYARQNGMGFLEVSAKTDLNITASFRNLISSIYAASNAGR